MESEFNPEEASSVAERAEVAPWIDYPPTSLWHWASIAVLIGATVFAIGEVGARPVLFIPLLLLLAAAMGAWVGFMVRRQGVLPRLSKAPAEFAPGLRAYWIGVGVLLAMIVVVFFAAGSEVAAVVAAIGVFFGAVLYQRRYDRAANALRARLK